MRIHEYTHNNLFRFHNLAPARLSSPFNGAHIRISEQFMNSYIWIGLTTICSSIFIYIYKQCRSQQVGFDAEWPPHQKFRVSQVFFIWQIHCILPSPFPEKFLATALIILYRWNKIYRLHDRKKRNIFNFFIYFILYVFCFFCVSFPFD